MKQLSITALTCSALLALSNPVKAQDSIYGAWTSFKSSWLPKSLIVSCGKLLGENEYAKYIRVSKNLSGVVSVEELVNDNWTERKLTNENDSSITFTQYEPQKLSIFSFEYFWKSLQDWYFNDIPSYKIQNYIEVKTQGSYIYMLSFSKSKVDISISPKTSKITFIATQSGEDNSDILKAANGYTVTTTNEFRTSEYNYDCYTVD
jgi:hypothetical protein